MITTRCTFPLPYQPAPGQALRFAKQPPSKTGISPSASLLERDAQYQELIAWLSEPKAFGGASRGDCMRRLRWRANLNAAFRPLLYTAVGLPFTLLVLPFALEPQGIAELKDFGKSFLKGRVIDLYRYRDLLENAEAWSRGSTQGAQYLAQQLIEAFIQKKLMAVFHFYAGEFRIPTTKIFLTPLGYRALKDTLRVQKGKPLGPTPTEFQPKDCSFKAPETTPSISLSKLISEPEKEALVHWLTQEFEPYIRIHDYQSQDTHCYRPLTLGQGLVLLNKAMQKNRWQRPWANFFKPGWVNRNHSTAGIRRNLEKSPPYNEHLAKTIALNLNVYEKKNLIRKIAVPGQDLPAGADHYYEWTPLGTAVLQAYRKRHPARFS